MQKVDDFVSLGARRVFLSTGAAPADDVLEKCRPRRDERPVITLSRTSETLEERQVLESAGDPELGQRWRRDAR